MKRAIVIAMACLSVACTQYRGPEGSYNTFGKSKMRECKEMVFPDGVAEGKEAIGFDCKEYSSEGISGEAASILLAVIKFLPGGQWLAGLGS